MASWRLVIVEEKGSGAGVFCRAERFCAFILVDWSVIGVTPQCAAPLHGFVSFRSETWGDALGWHGFAALVLAWAFSLWQALPLCERCELRARQTGSLFAPWREAHSVNPANLGNPVQRERRGFQGLLDEGDCAGRNFGFRRRPCLKMGCSSLLEGFPHFFRGRRWRKRGRPLVCGGCPRFWRGRSLFVRGCPPCKWGRSLFMWGIRRFFGGRPLFWRGRSLFIGGIPPLARGRPLANWGLPPFRVGTPPFARVAELDGAGAPPFHPAAE